MVSLESPHVGGDDQLGTMALATFQLGVVFNQVEARLCMVEGGSIEPHHSEVAAEMLLVTLGTVPICECGMVTLVLLDAVPLRLVALEAEIISDTSLSQAVAVGAVPNALEIRVCIGKLPWRNQLRPRGR